MASQVDKSALQAVAKGNMLFTMDLFKILREQPGNLFFSPISIEVILALTYTGAGGKTAEQMAAALHLPKERAVLESGFHSLMNSLKSTDNMTLEIANKIFGQAKFPFESSFKAVAEKSFLSAAQEMDFVNEAEKCRNVINHWVEERTRKKITNLIPEGLITPMTVMVLVNAIYFKGQWKLKFDPHNTRPEPFFISRDEKKEVQMMHIKKKFDYAERDEIQSKVLVLPYVGDKIVMVILLPNEVDGLETLENNIHKVDMEDILNSVSHVEVEVSLPRFKMETTIDLNKPLQTLGMIDMFSDSDADFSGLSKVPGVHVSNVLQKAFIEVNEEGSEAAAATVLNAQLLRARPKKIVQTFKVDHPFVFMLICEPEKQVLFTGRLKKL